MGFSAYADNTFSVDDFTVTSYEPVTVAVNLDNTAENITGYSMTLVAPQRMTITKVEANDSRLAYGWS